MLFENILFNNYLADYYEAYLFPEIPLEAKIFRILKDFIRRGHIIRCDPCSKAAQRVAFPEQWLFVLGPGPCFNVSMEPSPPQKSLGPAARHRCRAE